MIFDGVEIERINHSKVSIDLPCRETVKVEYEDRNKDITYICKNYCPAIYQNRLIHVYDLDCFYTRKKRRVKEIVDSSDEVDLKKELVKE